MAFISAEPELLHDDFTSLVQLQFLKLRGLEMSVIRLSWLGSDAKGGSRGLALCLSERLFLAWGDVSGTSLCVCVLPGQACACDSTRFDESFILCPRV